MSLELLRPVKRLLHLWIEVLGVVGLEPGFLLRESLLVLRVKDLGVLILRNVINHPLGWHKALVNRSSWVHSLMGLVDHSLSAQMALQLLRVLLRVVLAVVLVDGRHLFVDTVLRHTSLSLLVGMEGWKIWVVTPLMLILVLKWSLRGNTVTNLIRGTLVRLVCREVIQEGKILVGSRPFILSLLVMVLRVYS